MREIQFQKQEREEAILLSLKKLDYLSRSQIQRIHDLKGDRNARRILSNMEPYLSTFRGDTGVNVYYLNKEGRERVGCDVIRQKTNQVNHYLMRADAYIHYKGSDDWKNEMRFKLADGGLSIVADSYFRYNLKRHFLEVDHLQTMAKNQDKIKRYKQLQATGILQERLRYFPRLVWVTTMESRKTRLLEWCEGLDTVVHLWKEINF